MSITRLFPWLTVLAAWSSFSSGCDTSTLQKNGVWSTDSGTAGSDGHDSCAGGPVAWQTPTVSLAAREFWIVADGQCFTTAGATVDVHSDPGNASYTSLELTWTEQSREMRYFIYFSADATSWWSSEMRTYNAQPNGDWLYYYGRFFNSLIGAPFTGDVDLTNAADDSIRGELHLHGLQLATKLTGTTSNGPVAE